MTAWPHAIPFLPTYIPPDVDLNKVKADVGNGGVSAPAADVPGLRQVVAQAKQKGIDLKVVVIDKDPPVDTPLRDIATEVGHAYPGSTVLAISPVWAGTYSPTFDRVTLEAGQDIRCPVWRHGCKGEAPGRRFTTVVTLAFEQAFSDSSMVVTFSSTP